MSFKTPFSCCLLFLALFLGSCSSSPSMPTHIASIPTSRSKITPTSKSTSIPIPTVTATPTIYQDSGQCPDASTLSSICFTPRTLRLAYGIESLTEQGFTGAGETAIVIVSYGSQTLEQDVNQFSQQFGLPSLQLQILSPLGTISPTDPSLTSDEKDDMVEWAQETTLDVETIHAIAPQAKIVVLTSPVDEIEGLTGLPQFLQLEQYAVSHQLGTVISQSWTVSEATLTDATSQQFISQFSDFYHTATTQQNITFLASSGDQGATDDADVAATTVATSRTVNFPADVPWVIGVGGTTLENGNNTYEEQAWSDSGGGVSKIFQEPDFQKQLPTDIQSQLTGYRGIPDVAANADPKTAMVLCFKGQWVQIGGTSASTPLWAGLITLADQMAGHPLGFINPALYQIGLSMQSQSDFRDITIGNNTNTTLNPAVVGYQAQQGWDAVTGFGTPQGSTLLPDLVKAMKA